MPPKPRRLGCAETWASNDSDARLIELPGVTAWVHSVSMGPGHAGGDVHYLSVCPSCIVSRIALADVSGHGKAVAAVGEKLRTLMHQHLRELEQIALMRDLNQAVLKELGDAHYVTMVAIGWHGRRGLAVMTNAGHPPPLWYSASRDEWGWLDTPDAVHRDRPTGVPLGLFADVTYDRLVKKPKSGDVIVLYSDGVTEAIDPAGNDLGMNGLMNMVRTAESSSAEALGNQLASSLRAFRGAREAQDDETIIVMRSNGT